MEAQSSQLIAPLAPTSAAIRLLLDGRKLGDGGIGVYIDNTIRGLLALGGIDITVIASREQAERAEWRDQVEWFYDATRAYSLAEYFLLPRRIDFSRFDIYHSPHYTLPFGISIPVVVTIHDLIHVEHPESFYYPVVAKRLITSAARRANAIVAVSNDTRDAVARLTGVGIDKISHIPNAIPAFVVSNSDGSLSERAAAIGSDPYFITVISNHKPHKGVDDLLIAYAAMRAGYDSARLARPCPRLVLVGYGAEGLKRDRRLSGLVETTPGVTALGGVRSDMLRHLYRGADAVVVPSRAEGFCLPALEAQSVGTRVICRPVPALLELVTSRDLVASDRSPEALASVLLKAALEPSVRDDADAKHLGRFALPVVSRQLRDLYRAVISSARVGGAS